MTDTASPPRWTEYTPVAELAPALKNAKAHDQAAMGASVREFGFLEPVVLDERTSRLVSGHGRVEYLAELEASGAEPPEGVTLDDEGRWCWLVTRGWRSRDDAHAHAAGIALNRVGERGGWVPDTLVEMLDELRSEPTLLDAAGFTTTELDDLIASVNPQPEPSANTDPDEVPEPPPEPVTKPGDLWLLGPHRVLCGDCRDGGDVARVLLPGERVNLAFTSPPYADRRNYDASSGFRPIDPDEYVEWFDLVQAGVAHHLADDGSWFVNIKPHCEDGQRVLYVNDLVARHARGWGWLFVDEFAWVDTNNGVPGGWPNRFKDAWEPVYHFSRERQIKFRPLANATASELVFDYSPDTPKATTGSGLLGSGVEKHSGQARPSNVLQIPTKTIPVPHAAPFPIALPAWFIRAFTDPGDVVFDPFGGSGSTLIAAHQEGRLGRTIEISPAYVDVICRRYQEHTGDKPVLEATGEPVDFTAPG